MKLFKAGVRPDIGPMRFRSSWEANYARYLNLLLKIGAIEKWEFEPQCFWFHGIRRGTVSYLPDFRIWYKNDLRPEYHEIKGRVLPKDKTKWRRMAKYYPTVRMVVIGAKEYASIKAKWASAIPGWE